MTVTNHDPVVVDVVGVNHCTVNQMVVIGNHRLAQEIASDDGSGFVASEAFAVIAKDSETKPRAGTYFVLRTAREPGSIVTSAFDKLRELFKLLEPNRTLQLCGSDVVTWQYETKLFWEYTQLVVVW